MKAKKTAAFWGINQAVWQEHFDILRKLLPASFIYCDDGDSKFLLTTRTLLQDPYFI
jgi:hypothetical protein